MTVSVARTATPITAPVVPLMPLGRSTLRTGAPLALMASMMSCGSPLTGRLRPAPNSASMISAGAPMAPSHAGQHRAFPAARGERRIALQGVPLAQQDDGDAAAARHEFGRRDKTIAAIVAAPGDDEDRALLDEVHGRLRHRLPGPQHQSEARRASGDCQPVGMLHLGGRENFHAQFRPKAPHPEALLLARAQRMADDCMQIGLFAYSVSFAMFEPSPMVHRRAHFNGLITFQNQPF